MAPYDGTVVGLHGFTQSSSSWGPFGELMAAAYPWRALDLPGHGRGGPAGTLPEAAERVAAKLEGARCLLGYSFGARVALQLALQHPGELERLVLLSGTAGIANADERAERRASDAAQAEAIEQHGLDAFLDSWLAQPMFTGLRDLPYAREGREVNDATSLAGSLRLAGTGSMEPLWERLGELDLDLLVVVGEADAKFKALGLSIVEAVVGARFAVIGDAGHAVHLEAPEATAQAVLGFLAT